MLFVCVSAFPTENTQYSQQQQQQQTWDTQQGALANQTADGSHMTAGQPATNQQPVELWNAATGTWSYADPNTAYQQPVTTATGQENTQWAEQGYQQTGLTGYTQEHTTQQGMRFTMGNRMVAMVND